MTARLSDAKIRIDDPDLQELRRLAETRGVVVNVDTAAHLQRRPFIELRNPKRKRTTGALAVFLRACDAIAWLNAGRRVST